MAETANNPAPARAPEVVTTVTIPEEKGAKLEALPAPAPEAKNIPEEKAIIMTTEKAAPALSINALRAKSLSGILAMISFIVSLPILASVIWLLYMRDYDCENLLRLPRLQTGIGIALLFMFIISTAALFLRPKFPMPGFLLAVVPLLVMLTVGLALLGAYDMESRKILASPRWFKLKVDNPNNWNNIKSCIYDTKICDDLFLKSLTVKSYDFTMKKLSPIESGCCTPPAVCGMKFVNATSWIKGDNGAVNNTVPLDSDCDDENKLLDSDCDTWTNDRNVLCYDCQACKDGFVRTLESKWRKLGLFLVLMSLFLFVSHLFLFLATMWELVVVKENI
ncbi:tetraspanin-15 [Citrus sinensis]|uniref:Tetraspanin-15 n=1 Tax=Citrus sinensis TaxID=2711 RepID=A0ACB8P8X0_CITSI|nr:tetraspanin-15 [Citrus sinensis]